MWIAKIKIPYIEKTLFGNLAKNSRITLSGTSIKYEKKKEYLIVTASGLVSGTPLQIKRFYDLLKKEKRILNLEINKNFIICRAKQHPANEPLLSPKIFPIRPFIVNSNGEYLFELASFEKEEILKVVNSYKKFFGSTLINIQERKVSNIQTVNLNPDLTDKQKYCLHLAIEHSYYDSPRKIKLKELAKLARLSYSTYQFHLQNAEKKIMPYLGSLL